MQESVEMELFTEHTPPKLEKLFGYRKTKRWVAFFWGKKVGPYVLGYCYDGEVFNPLNQLAWDTFFGHSLIVAMNHRRVEGRAIKKFEFGDSLNPSKHWLLLDCKERFLFAASKASAVNQLIATSQLLAESSPHEAPNQIPPVVPDEQTHPGSAGALQMVEQMSEWLDAQRQWLEKNGQWPLLN